MSGSGWGVYPVEGYVHVAPQDDLLEHVLGRHCWCGPRVEDFVVVHHSVDQREDEE